MTKKLVIIRHGEASHSGGGDDFSRNLTDLGIQQNIYIAEKILQKDCCPEYLLSSNANRALTTAKLFANTWSIPTDGIKILPDIYEASQSKLLQIVNELDDTFNHAVIFGHNPGLSDLAEYLTGLNFQLTTSAALVLEFSHSSWMEISRNSSKILLFLEP